MKSNIQILIVTTPCDETNNREHRALMKQEAGKHTAAAPADVAAIFPPQLRTGDKRSTYYANNDLESVFVEEFLSHEKARNDSIAKADLLKFASLPGSTVHPHVENHLIRQANNKAPSPKPGHDRHHLIERGKALFQRTKFDKKPKKGRFTPYVEANSKIARILQRTRPKGKGKTCKRHSSTIIIS